MILELKGIYKNYQQGKMSVPVLKDVNFSMEEGEYVEYRIRVPKVQAYRQPVPARHAGDPLAAKR